jgi:hypothetical protein
MSMYRLCGSVISAKMVNTARVTMSYMNAVWDAAENNLRNVTPCTVSASWLGAYIISCDVSLCFHHVSLWPWLNVLSCLFLING